MKYGYTINNKLMANSDGKLLIKADAFDPYNPLNLPPGTIRVRTNDGQPPSSGKYDSATLVPGTTDVYDVYKSGNDFNRLLIRSKNVVEILGGNTSNVTNMYWMFINCTSLSSVHLFDTSNVTSMECMFQYDYSLQSVPLFDTSNVTDMGRICEECYALTSVPQFDISNVTDMQRSFAGCRNVQSGALNLYRVASSQPNLTASSASSTAHLATFRNCGINTETGSAELAQIPSDWK